MRAENKAVWQLTMAEFLHVQAVRLGIQALFCYTKAVFLQILCRLDLFVLGIGHFRVMRAVNVARISNVERMRPRRTRMLGRSRGVLELVPAVACGTCPAKSRGYGPVFASEALRDKSLE